MRKRASRHLAVTRARLVAATAALALGASAPTRAQVTSWAAPVSGAFEDPARWTDGSPAGFKTSIIDVPGDYVITAAAPMPDVGEVTVVATGAVLRSEPAGTIQSNGTHLRAGRFEVGSGVWYTRFVLINDSAKVSVFGGRLSTFSSSGVNLDAPLGIRPELRISAGEVLTQSLNFGSDGLAEVTGGLLGATRIFGNPNAHGTISVTGGTVSGLTAARGPGLAMLVTAGTVTSTGHCDFALGRASFSDAKVNIRGDLRVALNSTDVGLIEVGPGTDVGVTGWLQLMSETAAPSLSASVVQTGGVVQAGQQLILSRPSALYRITGGRLVVPTIANNGQLEIGGAADVAVTSLGMAKAGATIVHSGDATTTVTGGFGLDAGIFGGNPACLLDVRGGTLTARRITGSSTNFVIKQSGGLLGLDATTSRSSFAGSQWEQSGGVARLTGLYLTGSFTQTGGLTTVTGSVDGTGSVRVSGSGRFTASRVDIGSLSVGARFELRPTATETTPSVAGALLVNNDGTSVGSRVYSGFVDLWAGGLVVRNGDIAFIRDAVTAWTSRRGGSDNGIGSALAGTGSGADRFATVGVRAAGALPGLPAVTRFGNLDVTAADVLLRYTYFGDVNLDGLLDATDFNVVQARLAAAIPTNATWSDGDSDYDGDVDAADWARFLAAYQAQLPPMTWGRVIPEPAGVLLLPLATVGLRRRHRGRSPAQ